MYLRQVRFYCFDFHIDLMINVIFVLQLFRILFRTLNHQYDYLFDWTILRQSNSDDPAAAVSAVLAASGAANATLPGK